MPPIRYRLIDVTCRPFCTGVMVTMSDADQPKLTPLGLQATLGKLGNLRSFRVVGTQSRAFLAEFFDTRSAIQARDKLHNRKVEDTLRKYLVELPSPDEDR